MEVRRWLFARGAPECRIELTICCRTCLPWRDIAIWSVRTRILLWAVSDSCADHLVGMAKACADTNSPGENAAGFVSDDNPITGFSHLHDSGTGGSASMGNFPLFVHPGCPNDDFAQCKYTSMTREVSRVNGSAFASPGYFSIELNNSVRAEMTATMHAALYAFNFPNEAMVDNGAEEVPYSPLILVDLIDISNTRQQGGIQVYEDSGRIIGDGIYAPSFGVGEYSAFFCADFKGARIRKTGTFISTQATEEPKFLDGVRAGFSIPHGSAGAWVQFERPRRNQIMARVGVSFMSTDQACANAEAEIPDWKFGRTVKAAEDAWREKLSAVEVDPGEVSEMYQTTFWSGLYRTILSPQNYTGENQGWDSPEPYFDSFYCIWDSFRAQHPLLSIIDPPAQAEMVRALLDIYKHVGTYCDPGVQNLTCNGLIWATGKLPDCRMTFSKGHVQGGSNADVVIADAWLKNITEGIDWDLAYEAVVSDAEYEPENWGIEGRGNLMSYHKLGYIPWNDVDNNGTGPASRTVSRLVEFAYDDFAIGQLAKGLGHERDAQKYHRRGGNWKNIWNSEQRDIYRDDDGDVTTTIFKGFFQPRLLNGSFRYQNTRICSPISSRHSCYYDTGYDTYEGSPWLYSFYAPQDMRALIQLMGGKEMFVQRLTYFHTSGISYMGNEQAFLPVFQFHYGARPGLSSFWAHHYIPNEFNASVNGIPGNDDCAMGAFTSFAFMGFFPVAGQDVYLLIAPFFPEIKIQAKVPGKKAIIRVTNFDPTFESRYVQSVTLNGKPYTKSWISHDLFLNGGVLEFTVGRTESKTWGTRDEDLPPSFYPPLKELPLG
jgi:predicted alpha-1,2-mannosidase